MAANGQVLVNLGLVHRNNEWLPYWQDWLDWMREQGWRRFALSVWDQGPGLPGDWNGRLAPAFELVFHFNRKARKPNKIVPCKWAGHMRAYSDEGEVVYEPFAGSGTSLIAGERTGRKVRAIELAPAYVDLAILRWRRLFPDQPVILDGERQDFEAVARRRGIDLAAD